MFIFFGMVFSSFSVLRLDSGTWLQCLISH